MDAIDVPPGKRHRSSEEEAEKNKQKHWLSSSITCDDMVFKIIGRLPVDLQYDCRCVSKQWYRIVTDELLPPGKTGFIIQNPTTNSSTFIELNLEGNEVISSRDLNSDLLGTVKGSCNGLFFISRLDESQTPRLINRRYLDDSNTLRVVNALTEKFVTLPPCCRFSTAKTWGGIAFIPSTKEFKVVQLVSAHGNIHCEMMTLGSSNGSWRTMSIPGKRILRSEDQPVSLNGVLHLMLYCRSYLISIDAGDETMHQTMLPHKNVILKTSHLVEMGGFVALIERKYNTKLNVWILKDFRTSEWVYHCQFVIGNPWTTSWHQDRVTPIATLRNGQVFIFRTFGGGIRSALYAYDMEVKEMKKIDIEMSDDNLCFPSSLTAFSYPKDK